MNILFLTLADMENVDERGIYNDLIREISGRGINMYVVAPREKRTGFSTEISQKGNINILKVKTGNITKTSYFEKGISTLMIENQYLKSINRYFKGIHFDMVMYSTPPITFEKILKYYKQKHKSKTYLILKDIFPQNAVDIGAFKAGSFIWKYFRNKEKRLYMMSDIIGCMSKGNVDYITKHNQCLDDKIIEIFPNSILPIDNKARHMRNRSFLEKYGVAKDAILFVYGGNLGKPQGLDFILEVINNFHLVNNGYLLIVGSGTEYEKIRDHLKCYKHSNVSLLSKMAKHEYDQLLEVADVGLIFLDRRFTIPNFPSRLTAYMEYELPVLAATDINTDLKEVLQESNSGFWCESGDIMSFIKYADKLASDNTLRKEMGMSARRYLEENYDIRKTVGIITKHL